MEQRAPHKPSYNQPECLRGLDSPKAQAMQEKVRDVFKDALKKKRKDESLEKQMPKKTRVESEHDPTMHHQASLETGISTLG
ncbi:hypothetical protein L1987_63825 [Smallanthus sonchifolius]|uniref:Uncharacterized protein n=1 Tax=Smallanthus sonchifolius TaxID=185202 RepID=A0ACB9CEM7_9ASTR|nr:hypothetical protein L1987_63825 [Smallanthus sonchifolius]